MRSDKDSKRGVYRKYKITRTDGSHRAGRKHEHCAYFVLDLTHDQYAIPALKAYAEACRESFPALADDIDAIVASAQHTSFGPDPSEMALRLMDHEPTP